MKITYAKQAPAEAYPVDFEDEEGENFASALLRMQPVYFLENVQEMYLGELRNVRNYLTALQPALRPKIIVHDTEEVDGVLRAILDRCFESIQ